MYFKKIKELRENYDYTQQYVASYLKLDRVVYNRYENGKREIPISALIKLSHLYNVSIDYLVDRKKEQSLIKKK